MIGNLLTSPADPVCLHGRAHTMPSSWLSAGRDCDTGAPWIQWVFQAVPEGMPEPVSLLVECRLGLLCSTLPVRSANGIARTETS